MTPRRDGGQKLIQFLVTVEHAVRGEVVGRLHRPYPLAARHLPQRGMVPVNDTTPRSWLRAHHQQPLLNACLHHLAAPRLPTTAHSTRRWLYPGSRRPRVLPRSGYHFRLSVRHHRWSRTGWRGAGAVDGGWVGTLLIPAIGAGAACIAAGAAWRRTAAQKGADRGGNGIQ